MYGKILIKCELKVLTGLHIGASSSFSAIGAVDTPVVRDPLSGRPIVPGSSLKGKLRTLLARSLCRDIENMPEHRNDDSRILRLFGSAKPVMSSRLQFSDCFVINSAEMDNVGLTEVKFENTISRKDAVANPRQIERVNRGVRFGVNIVYEVKSPDDVREDMQLLAKGFKLLQLDYLGGHGSRGSGRVSFSGFVFDSVDYSGELSELKALFREVEDYELLAI